MSSYPSLPPSRASTETSSLAAISRLYQPQRPLREADHRVNQRAVINEDSRRSYEQLIRELCKHLPHLKNVLAPTRHERASIRVFDSFAHNAAPNKPWTWQVDLRERPNLEADIDHLTRYLKDIPSALTSRIVMVEDLCPQLSCLLGSVLDIDPQFFAQHLVNAGHIDGQYKDEPAELWSTHDSKKDYASIQWYRPLRPNWAFARTGVSRLQFLSKANDLDMEVASYVKQEGDSIEKRKLKPATNTFRDEWKLSIDLDEESTSTEPTALLERASVWRRGSNSTLIYICLWREEPQLTYESCAFVGPCTFDGRYKKHFKTHFSKRRF